MIIRKATKTAILAISALILAGCSSIATSQTPTPDYSFYALDPVFRELYSRLGGEEVLGEVISEMQESDGIKRQYVVGGLLIFDTNAPETHRFQFGNLAREFGILPAPEGVPDIAEPFQNIYKSLGGEPFIGPPMTAVIYDAEKNRHEQYFETLGFYMGPETGGKVRLLPYGLWKCGDDCRKPTFKNGLPELPRPTTPATLPESEAASQNNPPLPTQPLVEATTTAIPTATLEQAPKQPLEWTLMVWENAPSVTTQQSQGVGVYVFLNGAPAEGIALDLTLMLPEGSQQKLGFSPTDKDGFTRLRLPPIQAVNGTVISYQVCMNSPSGERYCLKESFQIWGNN